MAASTCSQRPCRRAMAAMASIGSIAVLGRRAGGRDDGARHPAGGEVRLDGLLERVRPHGPRVVERDLAHVVAAEAREQRRFFDRAVTVRRGIDDERRRLGLQPAAREAVVGRAFARAEQRHERARGCRVLNHATPGVGQPEHLPKPVGRDFFELGQRRDSTATPGPARRGRCSQSRRARSTGRRCRGSSRRTADAPSATGPGRRWSRGREDRVERLRLRRAGTSGSLRRTSPGAVCAITGARAPRAIVGDPVDELMATATEFLGGHRFEDHDMKPRASSTMAQRSARNVCAGRGQ